MTPVLGPLGLGPRFVPFGVEPQLKNLGYATGRLDEWMAVLVGV